MIKKFIFLILFFLIFLDFKGQQLVEFSMGASYQYDIYYSLSEGVTAFPERDNWELAFSTGYSPNIRINSGIGVTLFEVSNNIESWSEITDLPSSAVQLRNSNLDWQVGAFTVNGAEDVGDDWLEYNYGDIIFQSGTKIYIINYGQESKKIKINSFLNGTFNLTIANLDGSDEQVININTLDYTEKAFVFYSLTNNEIIDREPNSDSWDILFTKYEEEYVNLDGDTMPYIVTGGLSNGNMVAQYDGFLDVNPSFQSLDASFDINTIGYDWKQYSGSYTIVDNRAYYILSQDEESLYKIIFQSFAGGQSGNMSFLIEQLNYTPSSLHESKINFNIYPNPNTGSFIVNYEGADAQLEITDVNGRVLIQHTGSFLAIDINNLNNGIYFAKIITNDDIFAKQIIVNK
ncbi:MAG: hypothetical protein CMD23_03255 [Flavobacteriales bacterium]|nr:hypothetical protein [Flavobacteriales bacterium]|tara:strand:+ start:1319 stop:2527 length:1209 start_codon:yes stop_codon:yes gene_type:complete